MAKTYSSPEMNSSTSASPDASASDSSDISETGRKGGSTAATYPSSEGPAPIHDYTAATSEKSSARIIVPFLIAFIVIASFLALRSRFSPSPTGGNTAATNTTGSTSSGQSDATAR